jgi:hypothetical protein
LDYLLAILDYDGLAQDNFFTDLPIAICLGFEVCIFLSWFGVNVNADVDEIIIIILNM